MPSSGASMHFDGVDLSGSDYNVIVTRVDLTLRAAPRVDSQGLPHRHGGVTHGSLTDLRTIGVTAALWGDTGAEFEARVDALNALLAVDSDRSIRFDKRFPGRYWMGRPRGRVNAQYRAGLFSEFTLEFICSDPRAFDVDERTAPDFAIESDPEVLTVEEYDPVGGSTPTDPVWQLQNDDIYDSASPVVVDNQTTEQRLQWGGTLAPGDMLELDTARMLARVSGDDGATWSISMSAVIGEFPQLRHGVQNTVQLEGIADGTLSLVYRARYL